jgi:hypothetical protein
MTHRTWKGSARSSLRAGGSKWYRLPQGIPEDGGERPSRRTGGKLPLPSFRLVAPARPVASANIVYFQRPSALSDTIRKRQILGFSRPVSGGFKPQLPARTSEGPVWMGKVRGPPRVPGPVDDVEIISFTIDHVR